MNPPRARAWILAVSAAFVCTIAVAGCFSGPQASSEAGETHAGKQLIVSYGCGGCHTIPGIYTARGLVGPPLYFFGRRTMIAGELPNTPENLTRWLLNPRAIEPNTAMPSVGLNTQQAQDIAAYLETLH